MGMLRCPTCLTLLDGGEARCPACRSRLRKRTQPIVLGESARIASRPEFNLDRDPRDVAQASDAEARRRRRVAEATHRSAADTRPVTPRPGEPAEVVAELVWTSDPEPPREPAPLFAKLDTAPQTVAREIEPVVAAVVVDEPDAEAEVAAPAPAFPSVERERVVPAQRFSRANTEPEDESAPAARALIFTSVTPTPVVEPADDASPEPAPASSNSRFGLFDLTADDVHERPREEYKPAPSRTQRFIDLTSESESRSEPEPMIDLRADKPLDELGMHEMFEALHRKARAQESDVESTVPDVDDVAKPQTSRALRLTAARANRRRRWSAEFRGDHADSDGS